MTFKLLDPTTKQLEKIIREDEKNKLTDKLLDQLHVMRTTESGICFCDKCGIVRDLINKVI